MPEPMMPATPQGVPPGWDRPAAATEQELPPPVPPQMVEQRPGEAGSPTSRGGWSWSLTLPTAHDVSDRPRLGQVILGSACFFAYAAAALGVGRDAAAAVLARPLLTAVLVPLLVVAFVLTFRAPAFGRGFVLGAVVCVVAWLASDLF